MTCRKESPVTATIKKIAGFFDVAPESLAKALNEPHAFKPEKPEPTAEGRKRYSPTGTYDDGCGVYSCTCKPDCEDPCEGRCGCEACDAAYQDWLSIQ